jgi:hypothetical protein
MSSRTLAVLGVSGELSEATAFAGKSELSPILMIQKQVPDHTPERDGLLLRSIVADPDAAVVVKFDPWGKYLSVG